MKTGTLSLVFVLYALLTLGSILKIDLQNYSGDWPLNILKK